MTLFTTQRPSRWLLADVDPADDARDRPLRSPRSNHRPRANKQILNGIYAKPTTTSNCSD